MCANAIFPGRPERSYVTLAWLSISLIALSGCAATRQGTSLPDLSNWELRQEVLGGLREWQFKGRIAVKAGDEGFDGKFNWSQKDDAFTATVGGPLGIGMVRIEGDDRSIVLTEKDGAETVLVDAELELYYRYGWTIPIASLRYWALGIPDPRTPAETQIDERGRLVQLRQNDWVVEISRYREEAGQEMPRNLTATNTNTRVRMVIDKWIFFER
ncbi:MAG: outer membrane lipoprotein LolB [Proteobacteria bacterium]|nr:outer membrane lipoprotein LolB [Pseudomonadota bacterium]